MLSAVRILRRVSSRVSLGWKSIFCGSEEGEDDISFAFLEGFCGRLESDWLAEGDVGRVVMYVLPG